jgi:hypothetical protein
VVIVQLLSGKYEPLLVRENTFFFHYHAFYHMNCVRGLNLESEGLASKVPHENLHFA